MHPEVSGVGHSLATIVHQESENMDFFYLLSRVTHSKPTITYQHPLLNTGSRWTNCLIF